MRGQAHVTSALRTAVAEGRYGHAYLFSGPRGTGKTSTARILAKALNCDNVQDGEPCGECESCVAIEQGKSFDLHELDAASHNKVDDIRDLISKVHLGSPGRTKVYILDEVHMLSAGAENALLKTLEEPPEHVVFVLATTEPHKVVPTIRSRTQHFEFHLLPAEELAEHIEFIIEDAGLSVDDDAVDYVLAQGGGSARDTLSALDLVAAAGGVPAGSDVGVAVAKAIGSSDSAAAIAAVQDGLTSGQEPRIIGEITVDLLRNAFLASMGVPLDHLNDRTQELSRELASELGAAKLTRSLEAIGQALVEMRQAPDPRVPLEVTLLRLCGTPASTAAPAASPPAAPTAPSASGSPAAGAAASVPAAAIDPAVVDRIASLEQQVETLQAQLADVTANLATGAGAGGGGGEAGPSGPAAAARSKLSETTAKAPPSPRSKRRPGQ
ncbi:MAG: DNA polymerase III subunit gamma/tau, partial [Acidimicrobiales bacterium]